MNAVLKPQHIETIFDYDLTEEEKALLIAGMSEQEYLQASSPQRFYMGLAALFGMRGDKEKKQQYINKLDPEFVRTEINWDRIISPV